MSSRLSKIGSVHTYVMLRTVYFGWICSSKLHIFLALTSLISVFTSLTYFTRASKVLFCIWLKYPLFITGKQPTAKTIFLDHDQEPELINKIRDLALSFHKALQLRDFSMIDLRVDQNGKPWVLEGNLFCSFGPKSFLCIHGEESGWTEKKIFETMVKNISRRSLCPKD